MIKKGILVFILATGVLSCFCDDAAPFWNVANFNIEFLNEEGNWVASDSLTMDTIDVIVDLDVFYLSEASFKDFFTSTALATSQCPAAGDDGMKDAITNITLTCDQDYNDFSAGASLNSIVRFSQQEGFQVFLDQVATLGAVDFFSFRVVEKPTNLDSLKFNVQIDFASGINLKKESEFIKWK